MSVHMPGRKGAAAGEAIVVGRPWISDRDAMLERIAGVLASGRLSNNGPCVVELEQRVADLHGVRHCVAVSNGTAALELTLRAAGLTGEVILPSFTFVATAHAVTRAGLVPVFADVDPATHAVDAASAERLISPRTSAILGVNLWGRACDVDALSALADRYRLRLLFDSAHGFGCSHGGRMLGGNGAAETFSFHATKFFHTLEGGAVMTDDDDIADSVRRQRSFGVAESATSVVVGGNAKLNEVSAAIGLAQIDSLPERYELNRRRFELYRNELAAAPGVRLFEMPAGERSSYHYVIVEIDSELAGVDRDAVCERLLASNVLTRPYFDPPCHRLEPYRRRQVAGLEQTERLARRTLALPTGPAVCLADVERVCELIRSVVAPRKRPRVMHRFDALFRAPALPEAQAVPPDAPIAVLPLVERLDEQPLEGGAG